MTGDLIRCEREGCTALIAIGFDVDEPRADAIARREGWRVLVGVHRSRHWCPQCKEQS